MLDQLEPNEQGELISPCLSSSASEPHLRPRHRSPKPAHLRLWHKSGGGPCSQPGARPACPLQPILWCPRHSPVRQWPALLGGGCEGQRCLVPRSHHWVQQQEGLCQPHSFRRVLEPVSAGPAVCQRRARAHPCCRLLELSSGRRVSGLRQRASQFLRRRDNEETVHVWHLLRGTCLPFLQPREEWSWQQAADMPLLLRNGALMGLIQFTNVFQCCSDLLFSWV